ncbi:VaFE repeat-containing surface-anchored protein, partial [Corynebacterium mastitidis]|uniref:VaFE repeat-containing surface-anchored protein n=1 Tax=Corynebacterium mastitidis TaxID=161890 RepID=UPI003080FD4F
MNDTVTYKDLVPGKEYTLEAELKSKAEGNPVVGSGSATFTASESGSGEVVVPIKVNDDVTEPVEAAVAFETLKSDDAEAQENKAEGLPEGSADDVIAEHKDIDDEDQTVTSAEDQQAKIELKKYIGNQEFTGEEKPQAGGAGSAGVIDAQDTDNAYVAKVGQELTVTFAVKNSGALDLKDVTVSDELITGEGFESSELSAITPEKQDIAKGETKYFTATLKAPAAGALHGDKAKAEGTPVDEQGKETPFVDENGDRHEPGDKVPSNEDPAHAKTPEVKTADVKLKKYIGAKTEVASLSEAEDLNDSQTEDAAHEAAQADEDLTVAFVVENTGQLDLKDLKISDEAIKEAFKNAVDGTESGVDADTPQVSNIRAVDAEKQKLLPVGEKMVFVGDLKAPAAGKLHADKADVAGTPVDEEGEPTSYTPVDKDGKPQVDEQGNPVVNEPSTPVESQEDQAHTVTEPEFTPEIATSASVNADDEQKDFPATEDQTVFDSVTVENLVEGASYTLDAQLMKKSDSSEIAGATGSKTFTADESGLDGFVKNDDGSVSGSVVVEIPLKAGLLESGDSAVAFEELTSKVVDAKGNETPDASEPNAIAEHKDINDAKQTVTYEVKDETKPNSGKPSESVPPSEQPENPVVNPSDDSSDEPTPSSAKPEPQPSSEEPVETEEPTTSVTSEPAGPSDLEPSIKTSVDPKTMEIAPGGKVVDTVSYEGLKPGTEYTLRAQMVDKDDQNRVIGSGEKTFTTPDSDEESVDGSVDVDISFNADAKDVSSAVAFEELTSKVVDAKGNETPDASEPNAIAEHKDINDAAQTVNSEEKPGTPKLELKKYIGTQEFTGEEKLQDQPGADGVVDAQDPSKAFVAKDADQELTVTFVVTNTGGLDLKDVSVADELTDADTAGIELGEITPAKQDIKVGESVNFTATIKAPEAGKLHADEAKASGVPVDENGNEVPWTDADGKEHKPGEKVDSNVDPAHAKTPKPDEPKLELKKYINDNDA